MILRLSWNEVAEALKKHMELPGLDLGAPRVMQQHPYGSEEELQDIWLEFPINNPNAAEIPASVPVPLDTEPDVPF